jgi:nucleotide-binding universal stress UspA family protein
MTRSTDGIMNLPETLTLLLVPTDFSSSSRAAADQACMLANRFGASIVLLHVGSGAAEGEPFTGNALQEVYHRAREEQRRNAQRAMNTERERIEAAWPMLSISTDFVNGPAHDAICTWADENGADIIVMGTQGRSGLSWFMIGSTADRVIRASKVPVLTVRGPQHG